MSTLLVIDVQAPFLDKPGEDQGCWDAIAAALAQARAAGWRVVHVHHHEAGDDFDLTTDGGQPLPLAAPRDDESVIVKETSSALPAPGFTEAVAGDDPVFVIGGHAHYCVESTVRGLADQGRRVRVVEGALIAGDQSQRDGSVLGADAVRAHALTRMGNFARIVPVAVVGAVQTPLPPGPRAV